MNEKGKWSNGDVCLKRPDLIEDTPRVVCLSSSWVDSPSSGSSEFDELSRVLWAQVLFPSLHGDSVLEVPVCMCCAHITVSHSGFGCLWRTWVSWQSILGWHIALMRATDKP